MAERRTMFECEDCKRCFFSMEVFVRHECVQQGTGQENSNIEVPDGVMGIEIGPTEQVGEKPSPEFETQYNQQLAQKEQLSWSRVSSLLMLSEYAKRQSLIDEGKLRKKKAFEEISTIMSQIQFIFTGEQYATRLKTLVRGYKQVKDHNNKSGNQKKTYVYEKELDDIKGDKPNVKPACTVSSNQDEQHEGDDEMPVEEQRGRKRSQDDQDEVEMCKICMESAVCTAFVSCGHSLCCVSCAESMDKCPICRRSFEKYIRIFRCKTKKSRISLSLNT